MKQFTLSISLFAAALLTTQLAHAQTTYSSISIIGPAAVDWNTDTPLSLVSTANPHQWVLTTQLKADECKFRANNSWTVNWGTPSTPAGVSTFPSATGVANGGNIKVPTAGYYKITFDDTSGAYQFTAATPTATLTANTLSLGLALAPNPAHAATSVAYDLPAAATVSLTVRNALGQAVRQLPAVRQGAGHQEQQLSQLDLAAGVYLVQLQADGQRQTAKLVVN